MQREYKRKNIWREINKQKCIFPIYGEITLPAVRLTNKNAIVILLKQLPRLHFVEIILPHS